MVTSTEEKKRIGYKRKKETAPFEPDLVFF